METEERDELNDLIKNFAHLDPGDYVRSEELGLKMDFRDAVPTLESIRSLYRRVADSELELATDGALSALLSDARSIRNLLVEIIDFDVTAGGASDQRQDILHHRLPNLHDGALANSGPLIALSFAWTGGGDLERTRREVREKNDEMNAMLADTSAKLAERMEAADAVVSALQDKAAEEGVADRALYFERAADEYKDDKATWLKWARRVAIFGGGLGFANVVAVVFSIYQGWIDDTSSAIQIAIAKLVLFSFVYYVLVWLVRMYRAAAHNEIVNRHRFRAMRSFETFVAATRDDQTKQAVLLRATESIFDHQSSGLSPGLGKDASASRFLEIVRGVPPSTGDD